jgi:hypothetical protein
VTSALVSNTFRLPRDICLGEHHLHSYSKLSHMITFYSYTEHLFQHWSNFKRGYTSFYTTALSYVPLLCRVSHCFVARPITLSHVLLLYYSIHYSAVGSTTPPWASLLCCALYPSNSLQVGSVCVNKLLKSQTCLALCYSVGRVGFFINLLNIDNQALLVSLSKAHNINYKSLFLHSSKAYKTVVKRLKVRNLN